MSETETRTDEQQIEDILEHKEFVLDNCLKLSKWLRESGQLEMSKKLIVEGFTHDLDKFGGIQFLYMRKNAPESEQLSLAVKEHNSTNSHHPEAHSSIHEMDDLNLMVMACDVAARSQQFCTDVHRWLDEEGCRRYGFTSKDEVYKKLMTYLDAVLDKPLAQVTPSMERPKKKQNKKCLKSGCR